MTLRSRFTAAGLALCTSTALVACSSDKSRPDADSRACGNRDGNSRCNWRGPGR